MLGRILWTVACVEISVENPPVVGAPGQFDARYVAFLETIKSRCVRRRALVPRRIPRALHHQYSAEPVKLINDEVFTPKPNP